MYLYICFFDINVYKFNWCVCCYFCVGMNMFVFISLVIFYFVSFVFKIECESWLFKCCLGILEFVVVYVDGWNIWGYYG